MLMHPMDSRSPSAHFNTSRCPPLAALAHVLLIPRTAVLSCPLHHFQMSIPLLHMRKWPHPTDIHSLAPTATPPGVRPRLRRRMLIHPTDSRSLEPTAAPPDGRFRLHRGMWPTPRTSVLPSPFQHLEVSAFAALKHTLPSTDTVSFAHLNTPTCPLLAALAHVEPSPRTPFALAQSKQSDFPWPLFWSTSVRSTDIRSPSATATPPGVRLVPLQRTCVRSKETAPPRDPTAAQSGNPAAPARRTFFRSLCASPMRCPDSGARSPSHPLHTDRYNATAAYLSATANASTWSHSSAGRDAIVLRWRCPSGFANINSVAGDASF